MSSLSRKLSALDRAERRSLPPRLNVPAIGGAHQFAHYLPVAFELARRDAADLTIFVPDEEAGKQVRAYAARLGCPAPRTFIMTVPHWLWVSIPRKLRKIVGLVFWANRLRQCDVILCAERTSTLLRQLPGHCPPILHIPHGLGDRAVGFERRFRHFDLVLVGGAKDRQRLVDAGVVDPARCAITGPIKIASVIRQGAHHKPLFGNERRTILYNPHFDARLSSAEIFLDRLVADVLADDRFNLVIAPHVRMAASWDHKARWKWERHAVEGRIIVDLSSPRSLDMTYTMGADLYVGDVSSQVYEYLLHPRPCLFLDAHKADWRGNPDYAMWSLGQVADSTACIGKALDCAFSRHHEFLPLQIRRVRQVMEGIQWDDSFRPIFRGDDPVTRAADIITRFALAQIGHDRSPRQRRPIGRIHTGQEIAPYELNWSAKASSAKS
ncbi:glycosyl transferase [Croceicoccus pelagius]|uniref:glycosyl transferase n=1 Tax=Croceicoccus pelagius TaxID=1703341 RepID=UPI0016682FEE|nr:glycosyl transferase [Croceicoccus pelagius]